MCNYKEKVVSVDLALSMIKSRDVITVGMAASEPREFLGRLHTIADRVEDVTITSCLSTAPGEYLSPQYLEKAFKLESWFYSPQLRKLQSTGRVSFIPNNLHFAGSKRNTAVHTNIFISSASMPDEHGSIHLSSSNAYDVEVAKAADLVILEISPNIPYIHGDCSLSLAEVDYLIESDYRLPESPDIPSNEKDKMIGKYIAEYIKDGDCLQIGIGGIPNAVCDFISDKKDLGVHTEMMTTGIMRLMQCGAVNNSKKQINVGKSVFCFTFGTQALYDYINHNPELEMRPGSWVNDPYVIAQNDNQVSINTTIEIDLTGQCCSESLGHLQFSGTGGQSDTAIGAQNSRNGRSFIALYSTAMVKKQGSDEKEEISKIVPFLKPGAAVSLSRNDVQYVVTEYGVVSLKGLSIAERARALISIAHPKFREQLLEQAEKYMYL